jgi:hypothetical protein
VRYHHDSVSRILRQIGWSRQQPVTHATQRDDEAVLVWNTERWPAIKKKLLMNSAPLSGEMNRASI